MALQTIEIIGETSSSDKWTFKTIVTENSVNEENETSSITIENFLGRTTWQSSSYFEGNLSVSYRAGEESYDEYKYLNSGTIAPGSWYSIGSHTFDIPNNGETIEVGGSMSTSYFNPNSASSSGEITLSEILGKVRLMISGEWKKTKVYIGVNGEWKKAKPYIGVNGEWKKVK